MARLSDEQLWALAHAERAALAEDLAGLEAGQWRHATLCGDWDVEQVVAHLTAAASLGRRQWIASMLGARLRPAVHNQRRLEEHRGPAPAQTLEGFRAVVTATVTPTGRIAALLGEAIVHAQDIRQPLGLAREPAIEALTPVAGFFAAGNFAVPSHTRAAGLRLTADDGPFTAGEGPLVTGPTLALVMAMAGRPAYLAGLDGPGVAALRARLPSPAA